MLGLLLLSGTAAAQSPSAVPTGSASSNVPAAPTPSATAATPAAPVASPTPVTAAPAPASPSPTPDPLRSFQDRPGTETTPGGLDWQQADGPVQARRSGLEALTAWSGGFAAIEQRYRPGRETRAVAIWSSPDGRAWTRVPLPTLDGAVVALLPYRGGLALVTDDRRADPMVSGRAFRRHVWRSPDAIAWRRVGSFGDAVPAAYGSGWRLRVGAPMAVNGRLVVLAELDHSQGSGGWIGPRLASVRVWALGVPTARERRLMAWWSPDGATWRMDPVTGTQAAPEQTTWAPAGVRGFYPGLTESRDGVAWRRVAQAPPLYNWGGPDGLLWADGTSVVYGDLDAPERSEGCGNRLGVWRLERDGWSTTLDRQAAAVYGADADRATVILVGWSWCHPDDENAEWPWVLVSFDGARTWDPDASWVGAPDGCVADVAIHDDAAVLLACRGAADAPVPAIWAATLPPAAVVPTGFVAERR
jgi:hypothetical protein